MQVAEAYRVCRQIARSKAKNFYYAFVALPKEKRDAICAVYAFMRHADDLSDDESRPPAERRAQIEEWLAQWHAAAVQRAETQDATFIALRDAQQRFDIPMRLLDELVEGTTMDLRSDGKVSNREGSTFVHALNYDTYATFEDLYKYCYLVASVVGLVCIRIFGYNDDRAEKLAEETGIAFQLTNILRDVKEDAERGRIYLPLEDFERFGVTPDELAHIPPGHRLTLNQTELLEFQAQRAERYYQSGKRLLPLIAADSRPALWVLIAIYHRLLRHIKRKGFDVFSARVGVSTFEKLGILFCGMLQMLKNRLMPAPR